MSPIVVSLYGMLLKRPGYSLLLVHVMHGAGLRIDFHAHDQRAINGIDVGEQRTIVLLLDVADPKSFVADPGKVSFQNLPNIVGGKVSVDGPALVMV